METSGRGRATHVAATGPLGQVYVTAAREAKMDLLAVFSWVSNLPWGGLGLGGKLGTSLLQKLLWWAL